MCGRTTLRANAAEIREFFEATGNFKQKRMYNIPPGQTISIIRDIDGKRKLSGAYWGLLEKWAKVKARGDGWSNARAETITEKQAFARCFKLRRCLIPADGFYEWKRTYSKHKETYFFHRPDDGLFAFAGIWQTWESPGGDEIDSVALITTNPNPMMERIHDRMPVILPVSAYDRWLQTPPEKSDSLQSLLIPCPENELEVLRVSPFVNNARDEYEDPRCIEPFDGTVEYEDPFKPKKVKKGSKAEQSLFPMEE